MLRQSHFSFKVGTVAEARAQRALGASAVAAGLVRVRADIQQLAREEWDSFVLPNSSMMLGVHLRGSDKPIWQNWATPIDEYFPWIDAFLLQFGPDARIFLATDDLPLRNKMLDRYGARRVYQQAQGQILSGSIEAPLWANKSNSDAYRRGVEVLVDIMLLSRCNFLLKSQSQVGEFAMYLNPHLINNSYDFKVAGHPRPWWAPRL